MTHSTPWLLEIPQVSDSQLISWHQPHAPVVLGHVQVGRNLLVEADVPSDLDIVLCLGLLELLVIVRLQLDQGTEDVLILVTVLVSQQHRGRILIHPWLL